MYLLAVNCQRQCTATGTDTDSAITIDIEHHIIKVEVSIITNSQVLSNHTADEIRLWVGYFNDHWRVISLLRTSNSKDDIVEVKVCPVFKANETHIYGLVILIRTLSIEYCCMRSRGRIDIPVKKVSEKRFRTIMDLHVIVSIAIEFWRIGNILRGRVKLNNFHALEDSSTKEVTALEQHVTIIVYVSTVVGKYVLNLLEVTCSHNGEVILFVVVPATHVDLQLTVGRELSFNNNFIVSPSCKA